jgi:hypothetical protein
MTALVVSSNFFRICRSLFFLRGWPCRTVLFLEADHQNSALEQFKRDYEHVEALRVSSAAGYSECEPFLGRSSFNTMAVVQLVQHLKSTDFAMTPEFKRIPRG